MKDFKNFVGELEANYVPTKKPEMHINSSASAVDFLRPLFKKIHYKEEMWAVILDIANMTVGYFKVSEGGVNGTVCDPKIVFGHALLGHASGIILAHNHPSGRPRPSTADIKLTKKMVDGGKILDISVLDHVIITQESYYSFADDNML